MNISGDSSSYLYQTTAYSTTYKPQKPTAEELLNKVDSSGDGSVDESEFNALVSDIQEKTGQTIDAAFTDYDADGDGAYSSEELQSFMEANRPTDEEMAEMAEAGRAEGMGGMPPGPPPGPPPSESSSEEDEETDYIEELLASLDESSEESEVNSYLSILQSLQDELFSWSSSDDDEETSSTSASEYLSTLNQAVSESADYTSISLEA